MLFRTAAVLAAFLLAGCATDGRIRPPEKYINAYRGKFTVRHQSLSDTRLVCRNNSAIACAFPGRVCVIFISRDLLGYTEQAVMQHELAHCAGWPASHPAT